MIIDTFKFIEEIPPVVVNTPFSHYKAESSFIDSAGTNNATVTSGITYSSGKIGNGANFTTSYADFPYADFRFNNDISDLPFTINFWFKFSTLSSYMCAISKLTDLTANYEYALWWENSPKKWVLALKDGTNAVALTAQASKTDWVVGDYYMLTVTYNGSAMANGIKIYCNSVANTMTYVENTSYVKMRNTGTRVRVGVDGRSISTLNFKGQLDEISFFKTALTQTQINTLYNSGSGLTHPFTL